MTRIISFGNIDPKDLRENPIKAIWEAFTSLDKFTKSFIIVTILVIAATPLIVNNLLTIRQNAETPVQTPPAIDTSNKFVPGEALIKFKPGASIALQESLLKANQASVVKDIPQIGVKEIKVPDQALDAVITALSHNPAVEFVEKNSIATMQDTTPNDPWWPNEWGPVRTRTNKAWDTTTGISNTIIAILDSGVDFTQPDLQGKFVSGYDIVNNDTDPTDDNGHGTYIAGIAGTVSNNSTGIASFCWACSLMPVKVLGADGSGTMSNVASGIAWAADHGARIINMSLGSTSNSSTLQNAVSYAHNKGIVLFAAAGNYGNSTPVYPAAYPEVVSVAGTDGNDVLYSWSDYGSWVKISAPGCNPTTGRNAWYGTFCGTSSSSPAAAGIAGLALSLMPTATNTQIEQAIENSAVKVTNLIQYGRADAYGTLQALGATTSITSTPTPTPSSDITPPSVSIVSPLNGAGVTKLSNITISSNATDNVAVNKVETYVNGNLVCTVSTSTNGQYNCNWKVPGKKNANYTISAKAYDTSGNTASSANVSVVAQ